MDMSATSERYSQSGLDYITDVEFLLPLPLGALVYALLFFAISHFVLPYFDIARSSSSMRCSLAVNILASVFAIIASALGYTALLHLGNDFVYSTYMPLILDYNRVGFCFFVCDLTSSFVAFSLRDHIRHLPFRARLKSFVIHFPSLVIHHLVVGFIVLPLALIFFLDKGHTVMAAFALQEISTPFYSFHLALKTLDKTNSRVYVINGILFIVTFFVFRVCMFPVLYWRYHSLNGTGSFLQTITSLSWHCHLGSLFLTSIQYYWFFQILRKVYEQIVKKNTSSVRHKTE